MSEGECVSGKFFKLTLFLETFHAATWPRNSNSMLHRDSAKYLPLCQFQNCGLPQHLAECCHSNILFTEEGSIPQSFASSPSVNRPPPYLSPRVICYINLYNKPQMKYHQFLNVGSERHTSFSRALAMAPAPGDGKG